MNLFKISDKKIINKLGWKLYIRNGVGYGFISDESLYDNGFLELGFGRVESGYGDWGGGFSRATDSPLKITIDRNYIIQKLDTGSFYNSKESQRVEAKAMKLMGKLKAGIKLIIKDKELKNSVDTILDIIPCKHHIGWDVFESPHMGKFFTNANSEYDFRDARHI